jgi:hypothetical protein
MTDPNRATPKQIAKARKLFAAGVPIPTVIKRTGLTRRQVGYHCRDMPSPPRPGTIDCGDVQEAVDALASELGRAPTCQEVGDVFGLTKQAAHALMKKCGTERPGPSPFAVSLARQKEAARKEKQRRLIMARKVQRDDRIIALRTAGKTWAEIADRVGVHINTVGRVLRSAGV